MGKGFTVKAKSPVAKPKEPEWDYDKAREMIRNKTVVFCLPGRGVSYAFLKELLYSYALIWSKVEQVSKSLRIIHQWSTLLDASASVLTSFVVQIKNHGMVNLIMIINYGLIVISSLTRRSSGN